MPTPPARSSWRAWFVTSPSASSIATPVAAVNALGLFLLLSLILALCFQGIIYSWNWASIWRYRLLLWQGWMVTVLISLTSLAASLALGLAVALARRSSLILLRYVATLYV